MAFELANDECPSIDISKTCKMHLIQFFLAPFALQLHLHRRSPLHSHHRTRIPTSIPPQVSNLNVRQAPSHPPIPLPLAGTYGVTGRQATGKHDKRTDHSPFLDVSMCRVPPWGRFCDSAPLFWMGRARALTVHMFLFCWKFSLLCCVR